MDSSQLMCSSVLVSLWKLPQQSALTNSLYRWLMCHFFSYSHSRLLVALPLNLIQSPLDIRSFVYFLWLFCVTLTNWGIGSVAYLCNRWLCNSCLKFSPTFTFITACPPITPHSQICSCLRGSKCYAKLSKPRVQSDLQYLKKCLLPQFFHKPNREYLG